MTDSKVALFAVSPFALFAMRKNSTFNALNSSPYDGQYSFIVPRVAILMPNVVIDTTMCNNQ